MNSMIANAKDQQNAVRELDLAELESVAGGNQAAAPQYSYGGGWHVLSYGGH
ncbi:MAG TPA: hypothetical protein VKT70_16175 [Stellaceae bacterium]|nr:hypothetical protein [Stellaceae bacterium]